MRSTQRRSPCTELLSVVQKLAKSLMRRGEGDVTRPLAGWETAPGLVRTAYHGKGKLVVTRVTTGALSGTLNYTVENLIPLAVGVRSHVLTRIVTGVEAGNV